MNICITRSKKFVYSETFIRNQIRGISDRAPVYTLHTGRLPEKKEDDSWLSPLPVRIAGKLVRLITGRRDNYFTNIGLVNFYKRNKIEIVLANYGLSAAHLVSSCQKTGIPLVPHFHGYDATMHRVLKQYKNDYLKLFAYAPAVVAVSQVMKQKLVNAGADAAKVHVIPYGISLERFKPVAQNAEKELTFLAVGRFTAKKGPQITIRAFARILDEFPQARLLMIGGKDGLYEECAALTKSLGIENAVSFTGVMPSEEIAVMMQRAFAFVQHSVTPASGDMEGTPLSVLEAAASGLPVVSTMHGGIMEAVQHGSTGFLVPEYDEEAMSEYMRELAANPKLAAEMGLRAQMHIRENYNEEIQFEKLFQLLNKAAQASKQ